MGKKRRETRDAALPPPASAVPWAGLLVLLLATFAAYLPAARGAYIWDDDHYVQNPVLDRPDALRQIWTIGVTDQYYPLTFTSFLAEKKLWGPDPTGYHLVNVLLHVLNAALVWLVVGMLGIPGAGLAAAIFALHPVHAESVAWITERKNVLSGLFYLSSLACWLKSEEGEGGGRGWYWASLGLFVPALLSKTITCTLPGAFFLARWFKGRRLDARFLLSLVPYLLLGAAAAKVTVWVETAQSGASGPEFDLSAAQRLIVAGRAFWFYLGKLAWPAPLAFNYARWRPDASSALDWCWPLAAGGAAAWLWLNRERWGRGPAAATAYFAGTLLPALGFFKIYPQRYSYVADHFQYLSTIGFSALAGAAMSARFGWADPGGDDSRKWKGHLLAAAALAALFALTWRQAGTYLDSGTLWRSVLRHNPSSFLAHNNLGLELAAEGRTGEAIGHYRRALEANPLFPESHNNLGMALMGAGQDGEAEGHFREALRLKPDMASALNNLGLIMDGRGRPDEAMRFYERSLAARPGYALANYNIGNALIRRGKAAEAEKRFRLALEEWPDYAEARLNLANVIAQRGDADGAIAQYQRALRAKPSLAPAHNNLANALASQGRLDEAIVEYRAALAVKPDFPEAARSLEHVLKLKGAR